VEVVAPGDADSDVLAAEIAFKMRLRDQAGGVLRTSTRTMLYLLLLLLLRASV